MNVVVGAPVTQRAWVLPEWFRRLDAQEGVNLTYVMLYGDPSDGDPDGTLDLLLERKQRGDIHVLRDTQEEHRAQRKWTIERYKTMALLRNRLLLEVRKFQPDYYLSCDTDMLLPPGAVRALIGELETGGFDGVSPLAYMTPTGTVFPNALQEGWVKRHKPNGETLKVDSAFGVKLMSPWLYNVVDYRAHPMGEDIGWAVNGQQWGMRLGWVTGLKVKHVMKPEMLGTVDHRIGF